MLGGDVGVAEGSGLLARVADDARERARCARLLHRGSFGARKRRDGGVRPRNDVRPIDADRVEQSDGDSALLAEQSAQQVQRLDLRIPLLGGQADRFSQGLLGFRRQFVHRFSPSHGISMEGNALNVEPIPLKFGSPAPNPLGAAGERTPRAAGSLAMRSPASHRGRARHGPRRGATLSCRRSGPGHVRDYRELVGQSGGGERNGARSGNHKKLEARTRRAERGCAPSTLELSVSDQPSKSSEAVDNMESFPLMMDVRSAAEYACTGQA